VDPGTWLWLGLNSWEESVSPTVEGSQGWTHWENCGLNSGKRRETSCVWKWAGVLGQRTLRARYTGSIRALCLAPPWLPCAFPEG
jgi:hypothetical protein